VPYRLLPLAALAAVLAPAGGRAEMLEIDQASAGFVPGSRHSIQSYGPIGQTFRPSLGAIQWALLYTVAFAEGGAELVVRVREGSIVGPVLGQSAPVDLPAGFSGATHFRFGAPVPLTPRALYALEVAVTSRDFPSDNWGLASAGGPAYPRGDWVLEGRPSRATTCGSPRAPSPRPSPARCYWPAPAPSASAWPPDAAGGEGPPLRPPTRAARAGRPR